jgi:hypothetical protein
MLGHKTAVKFYRTSEVDYLFGKRIRFNENLKLRKAM